MPSISRSRKSKIIQNLATLSLTIRSLPALADIAHGRVRIDDLRELDIDDLLGRDQVDPNRELMDTQIAGRIVLVSGAGVDRKRTMSPGHKSESRYANTLRSIRVRPF